MRAFLAIFLATIPVALGDRLEEERWYNADGEVVKTVTRTVSKNEVESDPDWEPAWVIREREREQRSAAGYRQLRRFFGGRGGDGCGDGFPYAARYYYPRSYVSPGFAGFIRAGAGKIRWGPGCRASGLRVFVGR